MKVCLIGDLTDAVMLSLISFICGYINDNVTYVKKHDNQKPEEIAWESFSYIEEADTVLIIPGNGCDFNTIYEMTYAKKLGKRVMAFNKADVLVDITEFTEEDYNNLFY